MYKNTSDGANYRWRCLFETEKESSNLMHWRRSRRCKRLNWCRGRHGACTAPQSESFPGRTRSFSILCGNHTSNLYRVPSAVTYSHKERMGKRVAISGRQLRRWSTGRCSRETHPYSLASPLVGYLAAMGRYPVSMLESLPVSIAVGCILGFLAGLGVGGGSLLILWLTLVIGIDHNTARIINLLFFIPSAVIASIFRRKQGTLHIKKILPAILCGCISAALLSLLSQRIDTTIPQKIFGGLLLITGFRELTYKGSKNKK